MNSKYKVVDETDFRRPVLIGLMTFFMFFLVWHTVAELIYGLRIMALMEGALIFYTAFILYKVFHNRYSHRLAASFIIPVLSVMLAAMFHPQTPSNVFVWTFLVPVLTYALLGRKFGFQVTLICSLLAFAAYFSKIDDITAGANLLVVSDVVICLCVIWVIAHLYESFRERSAEAFRLMATTDALTGLQNRRQMKTAFLHLSSDADRQKKLMAVVVMDLDHFKNVNDQLGHDAGDAVLVHVAKLLLSSVRASDWVFRMGGEEFCLVCQVDGYYDALKVAESVRHTIESTPCHYNDRKIALSSSLGVAIYPVESKSFETLLQYADKCLYQAKRNGRNQVVGNLTISAENSGLDAI